MDTIVLTSFFVYITIFCIMQAVVGRARGVSNIQRFEHPYFHMYRTGSMVFVTIGVLTMGNSQSNAAFVRFFGIAICLFGLLLSSCAMHQLGKNWVGGIGLHKRHQLITNGPYRFVRHPLYSGMLVSAIGLCLVSLNFFYGFGCLMFAYAYIIRAPHEEKMMKDKFKLKYLTYTQTTGMIFPKILKRS